MYESSRQSCTIANLHSVKNGCVQCTYFGIVSVRAPRWDFEVSVSPWQIHNYFKVEFGVISQTCESVSRRIFGLRDRYFARFKTGQVLRRAINHTDYIAVVSTLDSHNQCRSWCWPWLHPWNFWKQTPNQVAWGWESPINQTASPAK